MKAIIQVLAALILMSPALAEQIVKKDLDENGKTDQVLFYSSSGEILKVVDRPG